MQNYYMISRSNGSEYKGAFSLYSTGQGLYGANKSSSDWGHGARFDASKGIVGGSTYATTEVRPCNIALLPLISY